MRVECVKFVRAVLLRLAELAESVPTRIRLVPGAVMRSSVLIRATIRAKTLAFGATQAEGRSGKQPLFTKSRSKIELLVLWVQEIDVWIIGLLIPALGENEVRLVAHMRSRLFETTTAFEGDVSFDSAVPVEPARARG